MNQSHTEVMMALAFAGIGLLATGLATLLVRGLAYRWRLALSVIVAGSTTGAAYAWGGGGFALLTATALALGVGPYLVFASPVVVALLDKLARRPALTASVLCAVGLTTLLGGFAWFDYEDEASIDRDMTSLSMVDAQPPLRTSTDADPRTDRGRKITTRSPIEPRTAAESTALEQAMLEGHRRKVNLIRTSNPTDQSNCHGWVFAGGRYWVEGKQVDAILSENGYVVVTTPQPGDLVIYREGEDNGVSHSALVRYVTAGQPVLVESKWGSMGVYLHQVDASIYGTSFKYYRSPRAGHVLAGLEPSRSADQANSTPTP